MALRLQSAIISWSKDQALAFQNGLYVVTQVGSGVLPFILTRHTDMDLAAEYSGAFIPVGLGGTANANTLWLANPTTPVTVGTTAIPFTQLNSATAITAGNGFTLTGNTIDAVGTASRISVAANSIDIDSAYVGQTSITTLGTIATGTWNATTIGVARGGTGATTLTGYVKGAGTAALTASATIPNTDISGLGTMFDAEFECCEYYRWQHKWNRDRRWQFLVFRYDSNPIINRDANHGRQVHPLSTAK